MPTENLADYCAPGTTIRDEMVRVTPDVSLRVITFTPASASSYPAIVFVAGWISLIRGWGKVLREMTKDFRVTYVETREKISSRIEGRVQFGVEDIGGDIVSLVGAAENR